MDRSIACLLDRAAADRRCRIAPVSGAPIVPGPLVLPADMQEFYRACGGLELFLGADFSCSIVSPARFRHANMTMALDPSSEDQSDRWYVVAENANEPLVVIDLDPARFGRCYDAFHEVYGVAGSMACVALSFFDLLRALLDNDGRHWYWLEPGWPPLGDAYE